MANPSHTKTKPRFTYHIIQNLHVIKARQYSVMACQIFTPLTLSTKALYHFVHSDSLCTLKGVQLKKDVIYISVHNSNKHTPSPSGILKARYLRFLNIFNFSITNLNIHFRVYKKTPPWNMCIIVKKIIALRSWKRLPLSERLHFHSCTFKNVLPPKDIPVTEEQKNIRVCAFSADTKGSLLS